MRESLESVGWRYDAARDGEDAVAWVGAVERELDAALRQLVVVRLAPVLIPIAAAALLAIVFSLVD
jgi:hypothetical protein